MHLPQAQHPEITWNTTHQRLEVHCSQWLKQQTVLHVDTWHAGCGWFSSTPNGPFQACGVDEPGMNLLAEHSHPAIEHWQSQIPRAVLQIVRRFRLGQFALVQLSAQHPEARKLLMDCPVLLWLIWEHANRCQWSSDQVATAIKLPLCKLLKLIDLNGTNESIEVLTAITPNNFDLFDLRLIRFSLSQPDCIKDISQRATAPRYYFQSLYRFPWAAGYPLANLLFFNSKSLSLFLDVSHRVKACEELLATAAELHKLRLCSTEKELAELFSYLREPMRTVPEVVEPESEECR